MGNQEKWHIIVFHARYDKALSAENYEKKK